MANKNVSLNKRSRKLMIRETTTAYLFLLPFLMFFVLFVIFPMISCVYAGFFDAVMGREEKTFVWFQNYVKMFQDPEFINALWNTIIIVVVSVPVTCAFSLWVASIISKLPVVATSAFRCIFYLPVVTGSVAVTMVWKWIYDYYNGVLNFLLGSDGIGLLDKNINWLGNPDTALWCIILILLTTSVGQPIVLYVSALDNVDKSLVEASEVDGATPFQSFWKIKWPQMMPTTLYVLIITTINSFQCFALIKLLTEGGSNTKTIMYYIYYAAFKDDNLGYGYGSAMGVVLAIIIAILSAAQFRAGREK